MKKIEKILNNKKVKNSIFSYLSSGEVRKFKSISHSFYEEGTKHLIGNLEDKNLHLSRIVPPSDVMERKLHIGLEVKPLQTLISNLSGKWDKSSKEFKQFNNMIEKIRLAVQSNLGLSRIQREKYETSHPIYVKQGAPDFPINNKGELDKNSISYQTEHSDDNKNRSPRVVFLKDNSGEDGLSICFDTKFRTYHLHVNGKGDVTSKLKLKWEAIYDDLLPNNNSPQPLRAFTPWQRHSEANFFNGRSTNKVLGLLTKNYPNIFRYNPSSYFKEEPAITVELTKTKPVAPPTDKENIYLTLDKSFFAKPKSFGNSSKREPILAVVKTTSSLRGDCFSVVPTIYENEKLHVLIKGHQEQTEIAEIFHANFKTGELHSWKLLQNVKVSGKCSKKHKPKSKELNLLSNQKPELMSHISTAPMVRGSGPAARQYWLNAFLTAKVYSEMIVIAGIFNRRFSDTPLKSLNETLNHSAATKSFYRLQFGEEELKKAKEFVFQLTIPNTFSKQEDFEFFYGKEGNKLEETTKLAIQLLKKMVPNEYHHKISIGINMCCPAASVENIGAGFGLRHRPDFIKRIVTAIKEVDPKLNVEFKTLMLSHEDSYSMKNDEKPTNTKTISLEQNKRFTKVVSNSNSNRLVYQGKPRNIETYDSDITSRIMKKAKTPKEFQFGFSGMVSTINNDDIHTLGYESIGKPHYSVQSILEKVKEHLGKVPPEFDVMLGRVLLGSTWLLQGYYASDAEILLHTLCQAAIERECAKGMGRYGFDIFQIQVLYNVRHLTHDNYRNSLICKVLNSQSMQEVIDKIFKQYLDIKKKGQCNMVKLHQLEKAVFTALPNNKHLDDYKQKVITVNKLGLFSSSSTKTSVETTSLTPKKLCSIL